MDWEKISDKFQAFGENLGSGVRRLFGSQTERMVRRLEPIVSEVNALESWAQGLSSQEIKDETAAIAKGVQAGEIELDKVLPKVFAMVREASVRTLGLRHFDVQLVGGIILHQGSIAEMMTGEGKTLVATLPLVLNALTGRGVFLVTVNDYLARRDSQWMTPVFEYMGLSCGAVQANMSPQERKEVYDCDIVYGTNNEFGFDYLRDNMKTRLEDQVQTDLYFAIIDEVDSILIDEARTPLIISGPVEQMADKYLLADQVARKLVRDEHYEVKEKERQVSLLEAGIEAAEEIVGVDSFYTEGNTDWPHYIENSLRAHEIYEKDKEYVVEPGNQGPEIVIVDEFTGRKMHGRRWSDGLHQAVETKEGLKIREENQTMATITFQNYFRLYDKLSGMTGTAITEAGEFFSTYGINVLQVPTNLPLGREDATDVVYRTEKEKWKAIVDEIGECQKGGQPVLVGTTSIETSEKLSGMLNRAGVTHAVLNAKQHEREASVVALAGEEGVVTVATNMAGRGTDIRLGGNFEYRLALALEEAGLVEGDEDHLEEIQVIREAVRKKCDEDEARVKELGGLYVLGTERHEARRIDNQLRGRSGRQGDPGVSRFFLSLQDDLMRRFYRDWVTNFMEKLGMTEGQAIESAMVTRAIKKAQKKVEDYHFEMRKSLLEYDEVMDEQRKTIYGVRQEVLEGVGLQERIEEMLRSSAERMTESFIEDGEGYAGWFQRDFGFELDRELADRAVAAEDADIEPVIEKIMERYAERREELTDELMQMVERTILLNTIDSKWKDHLHAIDSLKAGIGLRGYAQKDPKNEYKAEGFQLFQRLLESVANEVASLILRVQVTRPGEGPDSSFQQPKQVFKGGAPGQAGSAQGRPAGAAQPRRVAASHAFDAARYKAAMQQRQQAALEAQKAKQGEAGPEKKKAEQDVPVVGRNEPCPCGSGKKYKKCHGAK